MTEKLAGQLRTALAVLGGYLLASGKLTLLDLTSMIDMMQTVAGLISAGTAGLWSWKAKSEGKTDGE